MGKRKTEARQCSKTDFTDPDHKEYSEILKNTREKMERLVAPAMPCKRQTSIAKANAKLKIGYEKESKTMCGCIVESHASTRQRAESVQSKIHEDRIAQKGFTSMTHYNLVHRFIPMPQSMKIPDAKAAVDKELKKLETTPKEVVLDAQSDKNESQLCYTDGHMPPQKMRSWNQNYMSTKAESCSGRTL